MRRVLVALTLTAVAVGVTPSSAVMNAACTASLYEGVTLVNKTAKNTNGTVDVVDANKTDVFNITFGAGDHYLGVLTLNGDVDIAVCKRKSDGTWQRVCYSHNPSGLDGCVLTDADLNNGWPGIGPELGPGTYKLYVHNCFWSTGCEGIPGEVPSGYVAFWQ